MDAKRFTDSKSGDLRKYANPRTEKEDWLFLPDELPPNWEFSTELWPLLADAKESLGTLNGIGQTLPNPDLLLRPLQNREAITSSSIEGTYVTAKQLLMYDLDPYDPRSPDEVASDWREVFNYRSALVLGCHLVQGTAILNRHLLEVHRALMSGVRGARKSPGEFRRIQVQIGATGKYVPPPSSEISRLMGNFEKYINEGDDRFDPLVLCYIAHYQIEAIHPFADGNGRIGRVLLALMIYSVMKHTMPWLYLSAFFERHKQEYTDLLFGISTHGDWHKWVEFCLVGTIEQARDSIRRCHLISNLRDDYHERIGSTSTPRSHSIINRLFESPIVTVPVVADQCAVTYKTAQRDIDRLTSVGILHEVQHARPRTFFARELFQIAYESEEEAEEGT